ncbi:MAG TPA: hypothetical protein EYP59_07740 [Thiotrichaceae bacterium]|nr:hypothetical protein [Thiotrichaceae bacterium]
MSRLKKVILTALMILAACLGGTKAYLDHRLRLEFDTSIQSVADKVLIEYGDIRLSLLGSLIINDLRLTLADFVPVQIDTMTLYQAYQFYDLKTLPKQFSIVIQGLQLPISNSAPPVPVLMSAFGYAPYYLTPKALRGLGYARVKADVHCQAVVSEKHTSVLITANAYAWGDLKLSMDLNDVPIQMASLVKTAERIQLAHLIFSYTNKGLVNRVFKKWAQRQKMTLASFKQGLISKLTSDISQSGLKLDNSVLVSMRQFIQTPQTLTVHLQPNPPRRINTLFNSSPKSLGLKMTTQ